MLNPPASSAAWRVFVSHACFCAGSTTNPRLIQRFPPFRLERYDKDGGPVALLAGRLHPHPAPRVLELNLDAILSATEK